jgi:hypothetical protein
MVVSPRGGPVAKRGCKSESSLRGIASACAGYFRSAFAWVAILAVVVQLGSAAVRPAMANPAESDASAARSALAALLGPDVALCLHDGGSAPGSPSHDSHHCCDDCALCQLTGHAAALLPPDVFLPAQFARYLTPLGVPQERGLAKPRVLALAQPRAPPISL